MVQDPRLIQPNLYAAYDENKLLKILVENLKNLLEVKNQEILKLKTQLERLGGAL